MAKLGWFEADQDWFEMVGEMAADEGHEIAVSEFSYQPALLAIDGLTPGVINAAIVGSRLGGPRPRGGDGAELTKRLHLVEGIVVVGFTGDPDGVEGADFNILKHTGDPIESLRSVLGELNSQTSE